MAENPCFKLIFEGGSIDSTEATTAKAENTLFRLVEANPEMGNQPKAYRNVTAKIESNCEEMEQAM